MPLIMPVFWGFHGRHLSELKWGESCVCFESLGQMNCLGRGSFCAGLTLGCLLPCFSRGALGGRGGLMTQLLGKPGKPVEQLGL